MYTLLIINIDLQNRMPVEHVEFPESVEAKNAGDRLVVLLY